MLCVMALLTLIKQNVISKSPVGKFKFRLITREQSMLEESRRTSGVSIENRHARRPDLFNTIEGLVFSTPWTL